MGRNNDDLANLEINRTIKVIVKGVAVIHSLQSYSLDIWHTHSAYIFLPL